jgi:hypothetical protein
MDVPEIAQDAERNPEERLSTADRDYLKREDGTRHETTIGELARLDMDYATAEAGLVEADLGEAGDEADPADPTAGIPHRFGIGNVTVASHMRAIAKLGKDRWGVRVLESPGWATRGRSSLLTPAWVIAHHTAASVDVTNLLINGRPDVSGPLCNWALLKDGTWVLIASGRANHAGVASVSSSQSLGIEATGPVPVTARGVSAFPNYQSYLKLLAAHCLHFGWSTDRIKAHKEIAQPAGRKIDVAVPMDEMREYTKRLMGSGSTKPAEVDDLAGEGPEILAKINKQLSTYVQGQPDFQESNEALWDHIQSLEADVREILRLMKGSAGA